MASLLADPSARWDTSTYDPADNSGLFGDRMTLGAAVSRLKKEVKNPQGTYVTTTPNYTSGATVGYRLSPTLTAAVTTDAQVPVKVEDCLPAEEAFVVGSSNIAPEIVSLSPPADAELACAPGETYVRWNLGPQQINAALPQITYDAHVSATSTDGVKENDARVLAEGDPSTPAQRSAKADIQITSPAGIKIDKKALKPFIEVNRVGETNPASLDWQISFANIKVPTGVSDVDVIDVLPATGNAGSSFSGSLAFKSAAVTSGTGVVIQYTSAANPNLDPADPSNGATGTTGWCDAPGGTLVSGTGSCPATDADVTALRFLRPGAFTPSDSFTIDVSLTPTGNAASDVYVNQAEGRATGLQLPVGPIAAPERVIASAIGDDVWDDANLNGIQDAGEAPIQGFKVTLTGTDSDGNTVGPLATTTDASGKYLFTGLQSGDYTVTFDPDSLATGQHFTVKDGGNDLTDSDGDPVTGEATVTLPANTPDTSVDQGVFTARSTIEVTKSINGDDANTAPGVSVEPGSQMLVTFEVHNTGNLPLDPVVISDDTIASTDITCPKSTLAVDETMTCTAPYAAPAAGVLHHDVATATGTPTLPDGTKLPTVDDDDPAFATGATHAMAITKTLVGDPVDNGDGTSTVTYDVVVTNSGSTADTYDLDDRLHFGTGATVNGAMVISGPAGVTLDPTWNGLGNARIATGVSIPVDGVHTYRVSATASVSTASATRSSADCDLAKDESGTGFLNVAILTADGTLVDAHDCAPLPLPITTMTKALVGAPVANGDGTSTVAYDVTVHNGGTGPDTYDLTDTLQFGGGVSIVSADVTNTDPGTIAVSPTWDGVADTTVVTARPITAGATHVFRVVVVAAVATTLTNDQADCTLQTGETGTGFLNGATLTVNGAHVDDSACAVVSNPSVTVVKSINGDDANTAPGASVIPGSQMTVTFEVHNTGNVALDPVVVSDDTIASSAITCPQTALAVDETMTCTAQISAPAAGVLHHNLATVTGTPTLPDGTHLPTVTDDDPANATGAAATITIDKTVVGAPVDNGDGTSTVAYDLTVTNTSTVAGSYDLDDQLAFGAGVTVASAGVSNATPGTITTSATWNGAADARIVTDQALAAGATDVYRVTVVATVSSSISTTAADCSLDANETGTGFLNGATLTVDGKTTRDDACVPVEPPATTTTTTSSTTTSTTTTSTTTPNDSSTTTSTTTPNDSSTTTSSTTTPNDSSTTTSTTTPVTSSTTSSTTVPATSSTTSSTTVPGTSSSTTTPGSSSTTTSTTKPVTTSSTTTTPGTSSTVPGSSSTTPASPAAPVTPPASPASPTTPATPATPTMPGDPTAPAAPEGPSVQTADLDNIPTQSAPATGVLYRTRLARTGAASGKLVAIGFGLIAVGGMLVLVRRRQRFGV